MTRLTTTITRSTTVREAGELWVLGRLERMEVRPTTAQSYREALRSFADAVGPTRPVVSLTVEDVRRYQAKQASRVSSETVRLRLKAVRMFTTFLVEEKVLKLDPCGRLRLPPKIRAVPRGLQAPEVGRILAYAADTRELLAMSLMVREGLRAVEVSRLDLGDVDPRAMTLYIRRGKGDHQRLVPLTRQTLEIIERYVAEERGRQAGRLILAYRPDLALPGGGLIPQTIGKMVGAAMKRAGVREGGHALRHTFAYSMVDAGARAQDVQEALGHADLSTTATYMKRATVEELRRFVGQTEYHLDMLDEEQRRADSA